MTVAVLSLIVPSFFPIPSAPASRTRCQQLRVRAVPANNPQPLNGVDLIAKPDRISHARKKEQPRKPKEARSQTGRVLASPGPTPTWGTKVQYRRPPTPLTVRGVTSRCETWTKPGRNLP